MQREIVKYALLSAGLTTSYILGIASFLFYAPQLFGKDEGTETVLVPVVMLLLLVISAAITGFLVFGRPIMMYLDGKKKESVSLLFYTLSFLALITIFLISIL